MKILLIDLINNNMGDSVISSTCEYIIRQVDDSICITKMNLFPPKEIMTKYKNYKPFAFYKQCMSILKRINIQLRYRMDFKKWQEFTAPGTAAYNYYQSYIEQADKVIVAGGGLIKYSLEDFWNALYTITWVCYEHNVPLYINAVGVEGYDEANYRCQLLSDILLKENVIVSTRDDLVSLKKYLKNRKDAEIVGDPALFTGEAYNIIANKTSEIIGIGVIRGKIYSDYGFKFSEKNIIQAYVNIIKILEKNNYKWQLFCNGIIRDYEIAVKILRELNLPEDEKYLAKRPEKSEELVRNISSYKAVIAARLHANIIATSLRIPSIGLIWNDKLKFFGKLIGCENRFIEKEKFLDAEYVFAQLKEAIENNYNENIINKLKEDTKKLIKRFILGQ